MANDASIIAGTAANQAAFGTNNEVRNFPTQSGQWIDWYPPNFLKSVVPRYPVNVRTLAQSRKVQGSLQGAWVFDAMDYTQVQYIISTFFSTEFSPSATVSIKTYTANRTAKYYVVELDNPYLGDNGLEPAPVSWENVRLNWVVLSEITS